MNPSHPVPLSCRGIRSSENGTPRVNPHGVELPHCGLCRPQLSSVVTNAERVGFEAAALLDRLMAGETLPKHRILIPPTGVAVRGSTDVIAGNDPVVATGGRFIHEHACEGITVGDVLAHMVVSRKWSDLRFKQILGHTPHEEILRVRLNRARELLGETDLDVGTVAMRTGFRHATYLRAVFLKRCGQTPGQFRAECVSSRRTSDPGRGTDADDG